MVEIIVCAKQTPDLDQIKINKDTGEPIFISVPFEIEEMSKKSVEAGIRLKESVGGKLTVLSAGNLELKKTIKEILAMGADEAILITDKSVQDCDTAGISFILAHAIKRLKFDLIIVGEGSNDNYSCQIGPRIAEILGLPIVTFVRAMELHGNTLRCTRDLEDCYEIVEMLLPGVITITAECNEPRLPSLGAILKASKKPVQEWTFAVMGLSNFTPSSSVKRLSNLAPKMERKQMVFEGDDDETIEKFVVALQNEGYLMGGG